MRIGIDASCWVNRRGFGRFTRSLVAEMCRRDARNDYALVIDGPSASAGDLPEGVEVVRAGVAAPPAEAASADGRRRVADIARMTAAARRARADVFFFPATYSYFPVFGPPVVVTVHDAIAERLPHLVFGSRRARLLWTAKQRAALRRARAVVTVSAASRDALIDTLGVAGDRVHVVREAPAPAFRPFPQARRTPVLRRLGLAPEDPYLLYVGGISPHKNLATLIAAFEQVSATFPAVRLVLAGDADRDPFLSSASAVRDAIRRSPAGNRIMLTGFVPDEHLAALYGGAVATALPSLGEGFGLTAAESAACGTPVVASRDPALVELLADAGLYADARDPAAFAARFRELLADPAARESAARASLARASGWSWAPAADAVVELLERVGAAGRGRVGAVRG